MANHSVADQQRFLIQWFRTWSDYQKEDFTQIIAHKINPSHFINGLLVNGIQGLSTSNGAVSDSGDTTKTGRPPSLFSCQMKLFNEWWDSWKPEDRDAFTASVKDSDSKFWLDVEEELKGNRKKGDEEFFAIINSMNTAETEDDTNSKDAKEPSEVINNQVISNITTTTAVKVDLAVLDVNTAINVAPLENPSEKNGNDHIDEEDPKPVVKEQECLRINGSGDGVLVIEEDNDEII